MAANQITLIFYVALALVIIIVVFIVSRELVCWYFKINERIEQNERIVELLENQR